MGRWKSQTEDTRRVFEEVRPKLIKWGLSLLAALVVLGFIVWAAYSGNKTPWNVLELLIVPLALAAIAIWFNNAERQKDREIAADNQHEAIWQAYLDKMEELLKTGFLERSRKKEWRLEDKSNRDLARIRTVTALRTLDKGRRNILLEFLEYSELGEHLVSSASLQNIDLSNSRIGNLNLTNARLEQANLSRALLASTNLYVADLSKANLSGAIIAAANLTEAN